jgi:hypothetical protein
MKFPWEGKFFSFIYSLLAARIADEPKGLLSPNPLGEVPVNTYPLINR